jgi:hypothetical protein
MRGIEKRVDAVEDRLDTADALDHEEGRNWWEGHRRRVRLRERFMRRLHWTRDEALALYRFYERASQLRNEAAWDLEDKIGEAVGLTMEEHRALAKADLLDVDGEEVPEELAAVCDAVWKRYGEAYNGLEPEEREILDAETEKERRWGLEKPYYRRAYAKLSLALLDAEAEGCTDELAAVIGSKRGGRRAARQLGVIARSVLVAFRSHS